MVICLYGWEFLNLGHNAANVSGFRDCGSGKKTFLIFQVTQETIYLNDCLTLLVEASHVTTKTPPCHV